LGRRKSINVTDRMSYSEDAHFIAYNMAAQYRYINTGDNVSQKMRKLGLI